MVIRISVRAVVERTLHESDLMPGTGAMQRMREGVAAHRARQSEQQAAGTGYRAETALSADYEEGDLVLRVGGRVDGLWMREDGLYVIEEIKLGAADAPLIPAHMAQAALYGHMLCESEGLRRVVLRVLYVGSGGEVLRTYERIEDAKALKGKFEALCAPAAAWERKKLLRVQQRDASILDMPFPFPEYRKGQRRFAGNVYIAIRDRKRLFAQAATGIGKTMAALYPALHAMRQGLCARALFLTARTTGRLSALQAMRRLEQVGARAFTVELTAKDKICPQEERDCRPESCPYARGFYDRLPDALLEAVQRAGLYAGEDISRLAQRHCLCPFELTLSMAALADVVICDYNYVFDPFVAVDALMPGAALLVDEAHQLPPRVRDAYSVVVDTQEVSALRGEAAKAGIGALVGTLSGVLRVVQKTASSLRPGEERRLDAPPRALLGIMEAVLEIAQANLGAGKCALDALSLATRYVYAAGRFDARYAVVVAREERGARLSLLCLDASKEIFGLTRRARGTAYFSATLAPFEAAKCMLGSEEGDACLMLSSPFDPRQLTARIEPVDLRYTARERTAPVVAELIWRWLHEHEGNTIVFFPSYSYMAGIWQMLSAREEAKNTRLLCEARGMTEEDRLVMLGAFDGSGDERQTALFAVLGGAFSEGIDLPGERLKNVIVVSIGLPQPDARVQAMRGYYDAMGEDGFFLCMTWPGIVRVIQAAGRLIRTAEDTGTLLLIDSRFRGLVRLFDGTLIGAALRESGMAPGESGEGPWE